MRPGLRRPNHAAMPVDARGEVAGSRRVSVMEKVRHAADSRFIAVLLATTGLALSIVARVFEAKTFLYADLQHFFKFAEVAFTSAHFDYYASFADQTYTYAHLPLFPLLLAPFHRFALQVGWEPIFMVKGLVHAFEVGTFILIIVYAVRQHVPAVPATALGLAWLAAPWQFEASALNGHVTSVAAFFLLAAVLRRDVAWQAGALMALSTSARTEFIIAALALGGWYVRRDLRYGLGYAAGGLGVAAAIVGPFLLRDAAALHWGVIGHLQGRGDGLPVLRGFLQPLTGGFPAALEGPQDWAMRVAVVLAPLVGWASRDLGVGLLRASSLYALALALGHGRYFVLPLTAGIVAAATPTRWPWLAVAFLLEFVAPIPRDLRWIIRTFGIAALFAWTPLHALWFRSRRPARSDGARLR